MGVDPETFVALHRKLDSLRKRHRELEGELQLLSQEPGPHDFLAHRLKREKLTLKDQMVKVEALMVSDIIA
jgi:hypothetical protein